MDVYDMTKTTKCEVVIMMTLIEESSKAGFCHSRSWITTEFRAMPSVGSQRSECGQAKEMFDGYSPALTMF